MTGRQVPRVEAGPPIDASLAPAPVSLREATAVWARIGLLGFGGPAGQIALMHRELVERRRWISEPRFLHALNYCMLLPGPEAQQLAVYIGWLLHRTWGGVIAGTLFVLPGALVVLALSIAYMQFGAVPVVGAVLFGLKAAVLAIVVDAVRRIAARALRSRMLAGIAIAAFAAIFLFGVPFPLIVLGAGVLGATLDRARPSRSEPPGDAQADAGYVIDAALLRGELTHTRASARRAAMLASVFTVAWLVPPLAAIAWLGADSVVARQGVLFTQAALVTFGGAYAVLAYVAQQVVEHLHWLSPAQMIDGLALAETTPGPLILVLQFVAFVAAWQQPGMLAPLSAAVIAALLTSWVTFVPSFLWIFVGAPYVEALRHNRTWSAALSAITAAVVGVMANLSLWFALHVLFAEVDRHEAGVLDIAVPRWSTFDPLACLLALGAGIALLRYKAGMVPVMLACAVLGVVAHYARG